MLDANDGTPSTASSERWALQFGIAHPVLADAAGETSPFVTEGYPTYPVLNRDMVIIDTDLYPFNQGTLGQYISDGM